MWAKIWHNGMDAQIMTQGAIGNHVARYAYSHGFLFRYVGSGFR